MWKEGKKTTQEKWVNSASGNAAAEWRGTRRRLSCSPVAEKLTRQWLITSDSSPWIHRFRLTGLHQGTNVLLYNYSAISVHIQCNSSAIFQCTFRAITVRFFSADLFQCGFSVQFQCNSSAVLVQFQCNFSVQFLCNFSVQIQSNYSAVFQCRFIPVRFFSAVSEQLQCSSSAISVQFFSAISERFFSAVSVQFTCNFSMQIQSDSVQF